MRTLYLALGFSLLTVLQSRLVFETKDLRKDRYMLPNIIIYKSITVGNPHCHHGVSSWNPTRNRRFYQPIFLNFSLIKGSENWGTRWGGEMGWQYLPGVSTHISSVCEVKKWSATTEYHQQSGRTEREIVEADRPEQEAGKVFIFNI